MARMSDKKMMGVIVGVAAVIFLLVMGLLYIKYREYAKYSRENKRLATTAINKKNLEKERANLQEQVENSREWIEKASKILPDEGQTRKAKFQYLIEGFRTDCRLKKFAIGPLSFAEIASETEKELTFEQITRHAFKIELDGNILQIIKFINHIEMNPWFMSLDGFEIVRSQNDMEVKPFTPYLTSKRATIYVSTYTYKEKKEEPAKKKAPAGSAGRGGRS